MANQSLYDQAVELLAQVCLNANKDCYTSIKEDEDEAPCEFKDFGVDAETVKVILGSINTDISEVLTELQNQPKHQI